MDSITNKNLFTHSIDSIDSIDKYFCNNKSEKSKLSDFFKKMNPINCWKHSKAPSRSKKKKMLSSSSNTSYENEKKENFNELSLTNTNNKSKIPKQQPPRNNPEKPKNLIKPTALTVNYNKIANMYVNFIDKKEVMKEKTEENKKNINNNITDLVAKIKNDLSLSPVQRTELLVNIAMLTDYVSENANHKELRKVCKNLLLNYQSQLNNKKNQDQPPLKQALQNLVYFVKEKEENRPHEDVNGNTTHYTSTLLDAFTNTYNSNEEKKEEMGDFFGADFSFLTTVNTLQQKGAQDAKKVREKYKPSPKMPSQNDCNKELILQLQDIAKNSSHRNIEFHPKIIKCNQKKSWLSTKNTYSTVSSGTSQTEQKEIRPIQRKTCPVMFVLKINNNYISVIVLPNNTVYAMVPNGKDGYKEIIRDFFETKLVSSKNKKSNINVNINISNSNEDIHNFYSTSQLIDILSQTSDINKNQIKRIIGLLSTKQEPKKLPLKKQSEGTIDEKEENEEKMPQINPFDLQHDKNPGAFVGDDVLFSSLKQLTKNNNNILIADSILTVRGNEVLLGSNYQDLDNIPQELKNLFFIHKQANDLQNNQLLVVPVHSGSKYNNHFGTLIIAKDNYGQLQTFVFDSLGTNKNRTKPYNTVLLKLKINPTINANKKILPFQKYNDCGPLVFKFIESLQNNLKNNINVNSAWLENQLNNFKKTTKSSYADKNNKHSADIRKNLISHYIESLLPPTNLKTQYEIQKLQSYSKKKKKLN